MTVIMLLDDEADRSAATVEAALEISRLFDAGICCLDSSANLCGSPVGQAIRDDMATAPTGRCDICLDHGAALGEPVLKRTVFVITRSRETLQRLVSHGHGPVLFLPHDRPSFRLGSRVVIGLDGSSALDDLEIVAPLIDTARAIDVVTLRQAAFSDGERMIARLRSRNIPRVAAIEVVLSAATDADLGRECRRFGADWCLAGVGGSSVQALKSVAGFLDDPPCSLLLMVRRPARDIY